MNLVDKILRGYTEAQFFKGVISNCKSETLTHTSGKISTNWELFRGNVKRGKIETRYTHYVDFDMDNKVFRCNGEYPFRDGDKVALYAVPNANGYYQVLNAKNLTRDFFVPNDYKDIASLFVVAVICVLVCLFCIGACLEMPISQGILLGAGAIITLFGAIKSTLIMKNKIKEAIKINAKIKNYKE